MSCLSLKTSHQVSGLPCVVLLLLIPESFFCIEKLVFHIMQEMKNVLIFYDNLYTNELLWGYQKYLYLCFISRMSQANEGRTKFLAKKRSRSPRNTKEVCDILKMCNTNISIIFRLNKHKLLNFYMKPCWQKVFIRSKKFKNQLTFFNTVNHMTNSSLSNPCIDTPLNSSKFNMYIHLKIKLFNPKNEHKNKS